MLFVAFVEKLSYIMQEVVHGKIKEEKNTVPVAHKQIWFVPVLLFDIKRLLVD